MDNLSKDELKKLLYTVFNLTDNDRELLILVDLPGGAVHDGEDWKDTRSLVCEWYAMLKRDDFPPKVTICLYENTGQNNGELPPHVYKVQKPDELITAESLAEKGEKISLSGALEKADIVIAPTYFSATAPLKMLAKKYDFRGATMPGFTREMIPALSLDYEKVAARVKVLAEKMDRAIGFSLLLEADSKDYRSFFDLRFRKAHASTGLMREKGSVGNLPSGEAYIVPYEGEREDEKSKSKGLLPVQFGKEIVVYRIENNRAVSVEGSGEHFEAEGEMLKKEPAYGNISEIGIGILGDFGVKACGSLLLDEKLGLHIAFGRSEHFGGIVGPAAFNDPGNVVHIDRVYVDSLQPKIRIKEAKFVYQTGCEDFRQGK